MVEFWLKFTDETGDARSVLVEQEKFVIGRHSGNSLSIPNERLSREHIKIERFGDDIYIVSDCGSSNGTTLNGANLTEPVALKNKDILNLGGGFEIEIEVISDDANAANQSADDNGNDAETSVGANASSSSAAAGGSSIPMSFFWLAPVFGVLVLVFVGGLFIAFSGKPQKEVVQNDDGFIIKKTPKESSTDDDDETPTPKQQSSPKSVIENTSQTPEPTNSQPLPKVSSEIENVRQNSSLFLRAIALNDPKAYLEDKQVEIVNSKISQFKNSTALAENLKTVKRNAAEFETLAKSKNLKPQFLAIAALAKIGNAPGNPLEVAKTMLPVLGELKVTLANNLADDNLLIIAGYDKGAAGKPRALQSVIEALSKKSDNASAREIRTIWFLKDNGKITDAEFEFALRFLAIGTISQNPSNFNVNAEAITF